MSKRIIMNNIVEELKDGAQAYNYIPHIFVAFDNVLIISSHLMKNSSVIPSPFLFKDHLENNICSAHLVIPDKLNLFSPNTYVISVYSDEELKSIGSTLWFLDYKNKEIIQ